MTVHRQPDLGPDVPPPPPETTSAAPETGGRSHGRRSADRRAAIAGALMPVGIVATLLCLLTVGVVGFVAIRTADRAEQLAQELDRRERTDAGQARGAAWRLCEREDRGRAFDHYVAALLRAVEPDQARDDDVFLDTGYVLLDQRDLERILPIVGCDPNLNGQAARVLDDARQRTYVEDFIRGRLSPVPQVPPPSKPAGTG